MVFWLLHMLCNDNTTITITDYLHICIDALSQFFALELIKKRIRHGVLVMVKVFFNRQQCFRWMLKQEVLFFVWISNIKNLFDGIYPLTWFDTDTHFCYSFITTWGLTKTISLIFFVFQVSLHDRMSRYNRSFLSLT